MSLRDDVADAFRECVRSRAVLNKIREATGDPSAGHDEAEEVLGLLRVARGQRDTAEAEVARLTSALSSAEERAREAERLEVSIRDSRDAALRRLEDRIDCHAGPGTTEPGCGSCCTCLALHSHEAERRALAAERERDDALIEVGRLAALLETKGVDRG